MSGPGKPSATERLDRIEAALKRIEAKQDQVLGSLGWLKGNAETQPGHRKQT